MKTSSALLAHNAGNSPVSGEFPAQRPVTRSFDISLICAWINGWVNNREAGGCFTNVSRALKNNLSKFVYCRNRTSYENFILKLCTCAQSHALGTCTKFQLEILTIDVISSIVYFREILLKSSRNVRETTPWWSETPPCSLRHCN